VSIYEVVCNENIRVWLFLGLDTIYLAFFW